MPPPGEDIVGDLQWVEAGAEDTLADVARRHGLGYRQVLHANPGIDPWLPAAKARILLPTRHVLPRSPRSGIVINVAEMRLYYYMPAKKSEPARVMTFPVGVGRDMWKTPLGVGSVREHVKNPVWYPPQTIRDEHAADGDPLPAAVPPGPDNPLGPLALRLSWPSVLIHGTNRPFGVGMPVTHGCIRLYPAHIEELFANVPDGTPVVLIDEPYKVGIGGGLLQLEVHLSAMEETPKPLGREEALLRLKQKIGAELAGRVNWPAAATVMVEARGLPLPIQQQTAGDDGAKPQPPHL